MAGIVTGAPLACGAVHRSTIVATLGACAILAIIAAILGYRSPAVLKPHIGLALPFLFLLIAALQIVPIPWAARARVDPAGSQLLALAQLWGWQPISLDPPATYLEFAKAAAALAVGVAAMVLSSGRRLRSLVIGLVAWAGLAALVVGLAHRAVSEDKIYGLFSGGRGLPLGPFINPNHLAEFLELGTFASLAFAFSRPSADGQRVWKIVAAVLAAGAISTLSRGSVLGLGAGALTWFLLARKSDGGDRPHRTRSTGTAIAVVVGVGLAIGFGADGLIDRFTEANPGADTRIGLWRDALDVLRAHPSGIGLGAFARVYPLYRSRPPTLWFQFTENQPLGILIEGGVPGALLLTATSIWVLLRARRHMRRDSVEASLAAGLVGVLSHNLTDFGLETLGVLLPFSALLGAMFGRQAVGAEETSPRPSVGVAAFGAAATAGALIGLVLVLSPATQDFDSALRVSRPDTTKAIAQRASLLHPTDYAYALAEARFEPTPSLRMRMLNRAVLLCPLCPGAHVEAARLLWRVGRHPQSILEWKTALSSSPEELDKAFAELLQAGAKPEELMGLADRRIRYELGRRMLANGMTEAAENLLADAEERSSANFHVAAAQLALAKHDWVAARVASEAAMATSPRDPDVVLTAVEVALGLGDREKAIDILQSGLRAQPLHVDLNRRLLGLLVQTDQWQAIDRALAGLRAALAAVGGPTTEANLTAAAIFERRGQFRRAVSEYQAALTQDPGNIGLLLALAKAAEESGIVTTAIDAYADILRRDPAHAEAKAALTRIHQEKKNLEVLGVPPPPYPDTH